MDFNDLFSGNTIRFIFYIPLKSEMFFNKKKSSIVLHTVMLITFLDKLNYYQVEV